MLSLSEPGWRVYGSSLYYSSQLSAVCSYFKIKMFKKIREYTKTKRIQNQQKCTIKQRKSFNRKKTTLDGNLDLHKGMMSPRNRMCVNFRCISYICIYLNNWLPKGKIVTIYCEICDMSLISNVHLKTPKTRREEMGMYCFKLYTTHDII